MRCHTPLGALRAPELWAVPIVADRLSAVAPPAVVAVREEAKRAERAHDLAERLRAERAGTPTDGVLGRIFPPPPALTKTGA